VWPFAGHGCWRLNSFFALSLRLILPRLTNQVFSWAFFVLYKWLKMQLRKMRFLRRLFGTARYAAAMQKRTVTNRFELTKYQVNQLRALGRSLWPAINLPCAELCRRVLLDGVDRRMVTSDGERLLEAGCQLEA